MQATTTKQLMDQSRGFRIAFWSSLFFVCIGTFLMITYPFTSCRIYRYSCSFYFTSYFGNECVGTNGLRYCCSSGYSYCGSSNYCGVKPMSYGACDAVIITGGSFLGVGMLIAIFVFVMFYNFRSQVKNGGYINGQFPPQPQGVYNPVPQPYYPSNQPNPIIIYSDQKSAPSSNGTIYANPKPVNYSEHP